MSNSTEFLNTFIELEKVLKEELNDQGHKPFYALIGSLKHSNSYIRHYYIKLKEYADLRNAIVHERLDGRVIAEPNDYAVQELKTILGKISKPQNVLDVCRHPVKTLSSKEPLSKALKFMSQHGFSRVPIYDQNKFVEIE